mmetsp:Transcript_1062/g.1352  ORF Transcript_1062/g.1352 Transcript_1062/m.1352 type:complete len:215 (-) Transcript_1062:956-1600(-)
MAPCTAFWPSTEQYRESAAFAGTDRIMYEGSMYLMVAGMPSSRKKRSICSLIHSPILGSFLLPLASVSALAPSTSSPAPSATTTTACPCSWMRFFRCGRRPLGPSSTMGTSGTRQRSTSPEASAACAARNPLLRPMSFTMPTPRGRLQVASTFADWMAACAASMEVLNPKVRSSRPMSLSMVLGTPATATFSPRARHSMATRCAPRWVPSPPMT